MSNLEKVKCKGADGKDYLRQPCHIYTRVMGYLRMVSAFNIGKKTEFYSRKYFKTGCTCNREFTERYAVVEDSNTTLTIN